jgi:hypothetical protein
MTGLWTLQKEDYPYVIDPLFCYWMWAAGDDKMIHAE